MKKILLIVAIALVAVVGYQLLSSSKKSEQPLASNTEEINIEKLEAELPLLEVDNFLELTDDNLSIEDIDKALKEEENLTVPEEVEPEMVAETKDLMVELSMEEVEENFPSKEGINPVIAIELPKNSISNLNVGDTVALPYMGNGEFEAQITKKTEHKNGSVTVSGNLLDTGNQYSVVLTEGKNMSFGTVTTPNGSFEIETKDGQGYVYSTDSIDNEWIDYDKKDTLISSGHEEHNH
jgi:hypothetical protein